MEIFIARQPIFTVHKRLFAYELLYRGTKTATLGNTSGNKATTGVLSSAFLTEGIEKISGSKPCFINFTRELLLQNLPASFSSKHLVVEVLEDIPATADVVDACRLLRRDGYTIALDDFTYDPSLEPLIAVADIIKFDFRLTPANTLHRTLHRLSRHKLKYLAEKVETHEEFIQASRLGFHYFQGYFFSRPERVRIHEIDSGKASLVSLLAEVSQKRTTLKRLEKIIQSDVGLTYKLLRFLNSSYFYRLNKIESIAHAMAYLGENELRRFIILVIVSELITDKPGELMRLALVRAKMAELLAENTALAKNADEIFLLGLFSLLDAMLDSSMEYICKQLSLQDHLHHALVSQSGPYAPFLQVVTAYEKRDKETCLAGLKSLALSSEGLHKHYLEAIAFSSSIFD